MQNTNILLFFGFRPDTIHTSKNIEETQQCVVSQILYKLADNWHFDMTT